MKEEDPTKLAELFDRYRAEYLDDRDDTDGDAKRQRTEESVLLRTSVSQPRMLRWEWKKHRRQR